MLHLCADVDPHPGRDEVCGLRVVPNLAHRRGAGQATAEVLPCAQHGLGAGADGNLPGMTMTYTGPVMDAPNAHELADFYQRLLGWETSQDEPDWVALRAPDGIGHLSFQTEPLYKPPQWPAEQGTQQMMAHLDIEVDDLTVETARAVDEGAKVADFQPQQQVRVCLDPAGHPFCLWVREKLSA